MPIDSLPPLSLYVHLPWCVRKCPYCDFNSYTANGALPEDGYVEALLRDLDSERGFIEDRPMRTIFIGGGTPSLFSATAIRRLLDGIRARCHVAPDVEITLEANPGAADARHFAGYRAAGVSRLSIGVQSFREAQLAALGRVHDGHQARAALAAAKSAGFDDVNLDLMYALPNDDVAGALADLETALALEPTHLSWYQLTLEPNTAFHRRPPELPGEDVVAEIEERGRGLLAGNAFERYEVSAYSRRGHRCRHNVNYWSFGDYLGIGAGAHGKVTLRGAQGVMRRAKSRNPRTYVEHAGSDAAVDVLHVDTPRALVLEFMMNALRLIDGISIDCFEARTGQPFAAIEDAVDAATRRGWVTLDDGVLRTTPAGFEVLNRVLALF